MAVKRPGIQIPAWKRKYNEAFFAAGNRVPDGKSARGYNAEFAAQFKIPFGTVASHYSKIIKEYLSTDDEPEKLEGSTAWKDKVIEDIQGGHIPLVVAVYVKRIVQEYQVSYGTVNSYYYKTLREAKERQAEPPKPQPPNKLFQKVEEKKPEAPAEEPKKTPLHPGYSYRRGSVVKVKVTRVEPQFVLVETLDEHKLPGIIHISQVTNAFIADINKWFKLDLELNAQVIDYTEMDGGRLNLATRNLPFSALSWKYNKAAKEPVPYQEQLTEVASKLFKTEEKPKVGEPDMMELEWKQAKPYIEGVIGPVTVAAETEMRKIMKESGVFAFTVALMGKKDNFTPDIGLMLAQSIRKDLIPAEQEFPR